MIAIIRNCSVIEAEWMKTKTWYASVLVCSRSKLFVQWRDLWKATSLIISQCTLTRLIGNLVFVFRFTINLLESFVFETTEPFKSSMTYIEMKIQMWFLHTLNKMKKISRKNGFNFSIFVATFGILWIFHSTYFVNLWFDTVIFQSYLHNGSFHKILIFFLSKLEKNEIQ